MHLFLPRRHRPSPRKDVGRLPASHLRITISRSGMFSRMQVFRNVPASKFARPPDRSYRCEYSRGQLGLLRPSRTRFVASPRIGYANRPKTGNWRCGDLHPARLSALSAAPFPNMPSSTDPGDFDTDRSRTTMSTWPSPRGQRLGIPKFPQSVSRGATISGLPQFAYSLRPASLLVHGS